MIKIPQSSFGAERMTAIYGTAGGRVTIAGDQNRLGAHLRNSRLYQRTTRMTFIQNASTNGSVYSGHFGSPAEITDALTGGKASLVNLQSDVRCDKVRLPQKGDFTMKGLKLVKRYAWLVLLQNAFATFCAGMVIAASFYISLAEVKS